MNEIKEEKNNIDPKKTCLCKIWWKFFLNFNNFESSLKFASNIYNGKITLEEAKNEKYKMLKEIKDLEGYNPTNLDKINSTKGTLVSAEECN